MQITIQIREVYGTRKAYPACDSALRFADMAGTKTLTRHSLSLILQLGYDIKVMDGGGLIRAAQGDGVAASVDAVRQLECQ